MNLGEFKQLISGFSDDTELVACTGRPIIFNSIDYRQNIYHNPEAQGIFLSPGKRQIVLRMEIK